MIFFVPDNHAVEIELFIDRPRWLDSDGNKGQEMV